MSDELLLQFRKAAAIEHRLLDIESWLASKMPDSAKEQDRRWRIATIRALTLIVHDRRLKAFNEPILSYLRGVFEAQLGATE